ncbi:hypothetical protein BDN72DRAFT_897779 [Pluteus cervinus]|uniref:Uncharacterized protein n=1 Tax=Pluteus cervinus TaxID=181527 RepID=A0ACD3AT34_9AGAR|nr:hypothetical protein BDN72DRAFT_897779 [Pluteus cervinus]
MDQVRSSDIFRHFPWSVDPKKWVAVGTAKVINEALLQFEGANHAGLAPVEHLKSLLGIAGGKSSTSNIVVAHAIHTIWTYRLLDELSSLSLGLDPAIAEEKETSRKPFEEPFRGYSSNMKDWVLLLERVNDARKASQQQDVQLPCVDRKVALARSLVSYSSAHGWGVVLCNWMIAGLHLCLLLEERKHDVTNVESDLKALLSKLGAPELRLEGTAGFKSPLHLSLAISPLCLFAITELSSKRVNRASLLDTWRSLGSTRPVRLREVEKIVWKALFEIATQNIDVVLRVGDVLDRILALDLKQEWSRTWFSIDSSKRSSKTAAHVSGHEPQPQPQLAPTQAMDEPQPQLQLALTQAMNVDQPPPPYPEHEDSPSRAIADNCVISKRMDVDTGIDGDQGEKPVDDGVAAVIESSDDGMDVDEQEGDQDKDEDSERRLRRGRSGGSGDINRGRKPGRNARSASGSTRQIPHKRSRSLRRFAVPSKASPSPNTEKLVKRPKLNLTLKDDGLEEISADKWFGERPHALPRLERVTWSKPKLEGTEIRFIDLNGKIYSWTPSMHFTNQIKFCQGLPVAAEKSYAGGAPRYLSEQPDIKKQSAFRVLSAEEFHGKVIDLPAIFQTQSIVIKQRAPSSETFGQEAFDKITTPDKLLWIHGMYLSRPQRGGDTDARTVKGTAMQLVEAHKADRQKRKLLNCLALRLPRGEAPCEELSTDSYAFTATDTMWTTDARGHPYPSSSVTWALAATPDTHHFWHIDVNGLATRILVKSGVKVWFVAHPKPGSDFSATDFFHKIHLDDICPGEKWDIEYVVLRAGDELYMRPNTPHAVITLESSICYGGYLICYTTVREMCYGLLHCASHGHILTNVAEFPEAFLLLRRIMMYWADAVPTLQPNPHQPDLATVKGVFDILTVCMLAEVGNLFDDRFYQGTMEPREYVEVIEARRLSRKLVSWMTQALTVTKHGRVADVESDLYQPYLVHHLVTFSQVLKKHNRARKAQGLWTHDDFVDQLKKMFPDTQNRNFWHLWEKTSLHQIEKYSDGLRVEDYKLKRIDDRVPSKSTTGLTPPDEAWMKLHNVNLGTLLPHEDRSAVTENSRR